MNFIQRRFLQMNSFNLVDVCSVWSKDWKNTPEITDRIYTNIKPKGGSNAGKYSK